MKIPIIDETQKRIKLLQNGTRRSITTRRQEKYDDERTRPERFHGNNDACGRAICAGNYEMMLNGRAQQVCPGKIWFTGSASLCREILQFWFRTHSWNLRISKMHSGSGPARMSLFKFIYLIIGQ